MNGFAISALSDIDAASALALLGRVSLGFSLGLVWVLLLRRPLRAWLGAQGQYSLWALPPLMALAVAAAPGLAAQASGTEALQLPAVMVLLQAWSAPARGAWQLVQAWLAGIQPLAVQLLLLGWALGVLGLGLWAGAQHRVYRRRLRPGPGLWWAPAGSSPALLGCWRPRLVLPSDFAQRFSAEERSLVLAHEQGHAARHDNALRALAWGLAALQWFNPLVWLALPRLRQDQELACDAQVLARRPEAWPVYAQALLKAQGLPSAVPPLATAWQSTHPLIERIAMLKKMNSLSVARSSSRLRRHGGLLLALSLAAASLGVSAALSTGGQTEAQPAAAAKAERASTYCRVMPRPEIPELDIHGEFTLSARFRIDASNKVEVLSLQGDERLQSAVRRAIESYQCSMGKNKKVVEAMQEFRFRFD
ncbi:M56 family metallopeptidase [Paucibacter sp. DJ1R-11]|uniref:M56 family metallopeptidase n=1 Tax=Paucibacter sp. DJ1R-11 TaxID=2893556 RepID=UPI0021E4D9E5|nr:M56 family metallopeptidase [Paucibacter sp. DJ1R-11]MCV2362821.1 M56 family metallopeptidase [Paucibacter sp. DJ1R-11]